MSVDLAPDAIVIRFRPKEPQSVLDSALKEYRNSGYYRLSVFADTRRPNEDDAAVKLRLVQAAGLSKINLSGQKKFFVCTRAGRLTELGFEFVKDEYDGELEEHYSVDLGSTEPELGLIVRFLGPFDQEEKMP